MCQNETIYHEETYRGHTIKIVADPDPTNPYEDTEGLYPMIVESGRRNGGRKVYEDLDGEIIDQLRKMPLDQLRTLADQLDGGSDAVTDAEETEAAHRQEGDDQEERDGNIAAYLRDNLEELVNDAEGNDRLEMLESACKVMGWPCLNTCSTGYSQGDYADVLVAWTPEWGKRYGVKKEQAEKDGMKELKQNVKTWAAWAWGGGAMGYQVEGTACTDSCYGYLEAEPYPAEKTYVLAEARAAVDAGIKRATMEHGQRIKGWIRGHAPLEYRQPLGL
jgi:DNA-binding transcriptional MerR regulator